MSPATKKLQPLPEEEIILDSDIRDTVPCPPPVDEVFGQDSIFDDEDDAWI